MDYYQSYKSIQMKTLWTNNTVHKVFISAIPVVAFRASHPAKPLSRLRRGFVQGFLRLVSSRQSPEIPEGEAIYHAINLFLQRTIVPINPRPQVAWRRFPVREPKRLVPRANIAKLYQAGACGPFTWPAGKLETRVPCMASSFPYRHTLRFYCSPEDNDYGCFFLMILRIIYI
jgi:hypothetical protein